MATTHDSDSIDAGTGPVPPVEPAAGSASEMAASEMAASEMAASEMAAEPTLALQMAARVDKAMPPTITAICEAAALATIALLDDERSRPGGEWHEAVAAWNGRRIRKIMRRGRASAWERAQEPAGVTVGHGGAEVRAFVPGPLDEAPPALAKLQIQSTPLEEPDRVTSLPELSGAVEGGVVEGGVVEGGVVEGGVVEDGAAEGEMASGFELVVVVTPEVAMSWGKRAAQCAHAGQLAWQRADDERRRNWDGRGRPLRVIHADQTLWAALVPVAEVTVHDGGFTEIPAGTLTAIALWR